MYSMGETYKGKSSEGKEYKETILCKGNTLKDKSCYCKTCKSNACKANACKGYSCKGNTYKGEA
jgi:hypothetical protein